MKLITALLLSILLGSCASDYYTMNKFRNVIFPEVVGYKAANPMTVRLMTDDALIIEENSQTSLRKFYATQYEKTFILKKKSGDYFQITERMTPIDKDTTRGLKFNFSDNGVSIYENDRLIKVNPNFKLQSDTDYIFKIIQDGDYSTTIIDCDTIIKFKSKLPASEYTQFTTGNGTEIAIYSFNVQELYENVDL